MCLTTHYRDFHCQHRWACITLPCYPGMGFDNCPQFVDGQVRPLPARIVAKGEACPRWYVFFFLFHFPPCLVLFYYEGCRFGGFERDMGMVLLIGLAWW